MKFQHRIATIYRKELLDILRDHRTLIAMIVVPIVLYPLLMLGSVQAVSYQAEELKTETITIGVVGDDQRGALGELIKSDAAALAAEPPSETDSENDDPPVPLVNEKIAVFDRREALEAAIHSREIPVGVVFVGEGAALTPKDLAAIVSGKTVLEVDVLADKEEPRGMAASKRLRQFFERLNERAREDRNYADPFKVEPVDMSSPSSVLGAVLPLILILMTITGAIYPAIDLTAGERERGTLESLMVCPVSVFDLIVGKFLVVTTVAVMGAALNLASVTATVYFGGFGELIAQQGGKLPLGTMVFILIALIPFAVFMSAIMMAVCSYARTFKEAQNYVTPVILAVLIPGGIAAFPATRLEGVMLVMPVGNMVALAKEMLLGSQVSAWHVAIVLLSTCLYAVAAVGVAAAIFGKESVVFADAGSMRGSFRRAYRRYSPHPTLTMGLLVIALLFPAWFFVQSAVSPGPGEDVRPLLHATALLMPLLFVLLPMAVMWYWKVNLASALLLHLPRGRYLAAGFLVGLSAWVPAHEINVLQQAVVGTPHAVVENARIIGEALALMHPAMVLLIVAVVPAVSEELLFRGFLLGALGWSGRRWAAIIGSAAIFGVFHFFLFKLAVTVGLGMLFGYLCWQAKSIVPAVIAHLLHNAMNLVPILKPGWMPWLGLVEDAEGATWSHLPGPVVFVGLSAVAIGVALARRPTKSGGLVPRPVAAPAS